jgi:hypothetical protein
MNLKKLVLFKLLALVLIGLGFSAVTALTQGVTLTTGLDEPENPKLQRQLALLAKSGPSSVGFGIIFVPGTEPEELARHTVRTVFEAKDTKNLTKIRRAIESVGGRFETMHENLVQALVPIGALDKLSQLEEVDFARLPNMPILHDVQSEGLSNMGIEAWKNASIDGHGVKVAIVDAGFEGYKNLLGSELPPEDRVIVKSFRRDGDIEAKQDHGAAVAEIVFDIAPGATFYLVNIGTDVEFLNAVDYLIAEKINVVNTSLSFATGCPHENRGELEPVLEKARKAGIFWATSAGNTGRGHWMGDWNDPDKNSLLNFTADDESQSIRLQKDDVLVMALSWDDPCGTAQNDYDILVKDGDGKELARSGRSGPRGWPLEFLGYRVPSSGVYDILIKRNRGTGINTVDLWSREDLQHRVSESSIGVSEPSISGNVMSAGAIDFGTNRLRNYSSRGPTKSGRIKPDVAAPDGVSTDTYGPESSASGGFFGTSASSPHLAGAGALVKSRFAELTPEQIQAYLEARAKKNVVEGDKDNIYGAGLLFLGDPNDKPKANVAPTADAGADQSLKQGETVQLDAGNSKDADGDKLRYIWAFAKKPQTSYARFSNPASAKPTFVADVGGEFVMELIVEDGKGGSARAQVKVTVAAVNRNPQANAGTDQTVKTGETVVLDGTKSSDPDNDQLKYSWAFVSRPEGSQAKIAEPTAGKTSFVPDVAGTYVVELTVDDGKGGTAKAQVKITVAAANRAPQANAGTDQTVKTGATVNLDAGKSSDPDGDQLKFNWAFISKPSNSQAKIAEPTAGKTSFVADVAGTYLIELTVDDSKGGIAKAQVRVTAQADQQPATGQVLVLAFNKLEFLDPAAWERALSSGCVSYKNKSSAPAKIRVMTTDNQVLEFEIAPGKEVIVCGEAVHIDTRP